MIRALDLFCGAGGATKGLQRAGFYVVGVDHKPQPRYCGDEFYQADAMTFPLHEYECECGHIFSESLGKYGCPNCCGENDVTRRPFDFIWASPPCQKFTSLKSMPNAKEHPDLLTPTRTRLQKAGVPYVIENVPGAPLAKGSIMLCGTMFGLGVKAAGAELRRHRWFECSRYFFAPECRHSRQVIGVYGGGGVHSGRPARRPRTVGVWGGAGGTSTRDGVQQFSTAERSEAMGIDWMTGSELSQAIPPAYSHYIAEQMRASIEATEAA